MRYGITTKTIQQLRANPASKEELFKEMSDTFDYALPQEWLNSFADWCEHSLPVVYGKLTYDLIRSTSVMAYPKDDFARVVSACEEVHTALQLYGMSDAERKERGCGSVATEDANV
tara:strand:+ start:124 stop:471 length:348 start_codon:yes stop_codon:yes gene_type:complete